MKGTSIRAYKQARDKGILSKRRYEVVIALTMMEEPATAREVYEYLKVKAWKEERRMPPQHSINPRFAELQRNGMVELGPVRACSWTGVETQTWKSTGLIPEKFDVRRPKRRKCWACGQVLATEKAEAECEQTYR